MRQKSPSNRTVRDAALPPSRSTVSAKRGIATVSISWRAVATLCSSRLNIVGGPSGAGGKKEGDALGLASAASGTPAVR